MATLVLANLFAINVLMGISITNLFTHQSFYQAVVSFLERACIQGWL
jgi:hypothetical protein